MLAIWTPFIQKSKANISKFRTQKTVHMFLFFGAMNTFGLSYYLKHIKREEYEDDLLLKHRSQIIEFEKKIN